MLSTHVPRISPFSSSVFHTASALSAPSGHLPLEGKALCRGQRHSRKWRTCDDLPTLFHTASTLSAPSGHLPLEGKALYRGQRHSRKWRTCDDLLALFHAASTLSGSLRSPPSPRGEGFVSGTAALSQMPCFHFVQIKTALRGWALQSGFWFYYSTVTDFARFLGLSTSFPLLIEV